MRFVDVMFSFPDLLLIIIVMTTLRAATSRDDAGPIAHLCRQCGRVVWRAIGVLISLALISWLTVARLVRGQILSLKEKEFVEAATAMGASIHGSFALT